MFEDERTVNKEFRRGVDDLEKAIVEGLIRNLPVNPEILKVVADISRQAQVLRILVNASDCEV